MESTAINEEGPTAAACERIVGIDLSHFDTQTRAKIYNYVDILIPGKRGGKLRKICGTRFSIRTSRGKLISVKLQPPPE